MPELPEVESVVRQLRPVLVGRVVRRAHVGWRRTVGERPSFERDVRGRAIEGVDRRGKYLLFHLDRGALVGHLRMSGRMRVHARGFEPGPHSRVWLDLSGGAVFEFEDVRKFGRLLYARRAGAALPPLGPEPLGAEFTSGWLCEALSARKRQIKPLLLDQAFLAGLGNIYVDEALYAARIHPLRPSHRVGKRKAIALHAAIRAILGRAVLRRGTSFDDAYRTPDGRPGDYQRELRVYGREGRPCGRCGARIRRIVVVQRGTHLCPRCQRR